MCGILGSDVSDVRQKDRERVSGVSGDCCIGIFSDLFELTLSYVNSWYVEVLRRFGLS